MTSTGLERHRPKTIAVIATFLFAATTIAFITGESLLFPNALLDKLWKFNPQGAALFHSIGRVSGVFLMALGIGTFFAALGLLRGQLWAWWFGVFLFAIDACGNIVSYFLTHDALRSLTGAIISATFLFFLCRDSVRGYFLRQL
jgi:sterol desaturase/sphingolipid hydroxylase (fatty acid hydroxylase superfamily)